MKRRKYICMLLTVPLTLGGCGSIPDTTAALPKEENIPEPVLQTVRASSNAAGDPALASIIPQETVTFDVYSQLSGYYGEQQGWFAQILLDKFNVKLNFIFDGSDDFYERMASGGDLGDIILWGTDSD